MMIAARSSYMDFMYLVLLPAAPEPHDMVS